MNFRSKLFWILVGLLPFFAAGQKVTGYMGKRMFVGVQLNHSPDFYNLGFESSGDPSQMNYSGKEYFYVFQAPRIGISAGYVIKQSRSITIDVDFLRGGLDNGGDITDYNTGQKFFYGFSRYSLTNYKFRYQKCKMGGLSPLGLHSGLTLQYTSANVSVTDLHNRNFITKRYSDFAIGTAVNMRRIFNDNLMLDLGIDVNFCMGWLFAIDRNSGYSAQENKTPEEKVSDDAKRAFYTKNALNNILTTRIALYYLLDAK